MEFGKRLREVRMQRGLTQDKISEMLGVALRTYQCYEQGKREPKFATLIRMADILDVSLDYLMGRTQGIKHE